MFLERAVIDYLYKHQTANVGYGNDSKYILPFWVEPHAHQANSKQSGKAHQILRFFIKREGVEENWTHPSLIFTFTYIFQPSAAPQQCADFVLKF